VSEANAVVAYNTANRDRHTCGGRLARWHLKSFNEAIYQLVVQSGARTVLDAGCGEGFVAAYFAQRNPVLQLTGIDCSPEAIVYARQHFGQFASFLVGNVLHLPYADDAFDVVVCSEVLEHVADWDRALAELVRVARTHVVVTVPHEPYFKILNDAARAVGFCQDPGHVNFWSGTAFRKMISARFSSVVFQRKHLIYQLALGRL